MKKMILLSMVLLISILCPLSSESANRPITQTWDVGNGARRVMELSLFQADGVDFDLTSLDGEDAFALSTNDTVVWQITGWTDYTNLYASCTGVVNDALSGTTSYTFEPSALNLPAGTYRGFVKAMTGPETNATTRAVLAYQRIRMEFSPNSGNYSIVEPAPGNYYTKDEVDALLASATDTNLAAVVATATNDIATLTSDFQTLKTNAVLRTDLDGGWYYPNWFYWSFSQVADGIPDTTTVVTNKDVVLDRNVYAAKGGSWDISYSGLRLTDFSEPAVTSSSPSVATCTVDKVWYVSEGTATVTATVGDFQRSTNLVMEIVSSLTNDVVTGCVTGSAVCAFAAGIDSRLTDGTDLAVYSTQDHTATNYVRNTNSWVADIDLTCVSPWNSTGDAWLAAQTGLDKGAYRAGTLIGSDCILFANHYPISVGATIRFVTSSNTVVERTLAARQRVGYTDFMVARLSSAISTNDCRPALLLPFDQTNYMVWLREYGEQRPGLFIDQYENAYAGNLPYLIASSSWRQSTNATRALYWKTPVVGDSGSPMMLVAPTGLPIITGTFYSSSGGPSVGNQNAAIRAAAAAIGCDTSTITDADFDAAGYTNFNPGPPTPGE